MRPFVFMLTLLTPCLALSQDQADLRSRLGHADPRTRAQAALALGRLGAKARPSASALLSALADSDPDVVSCAAKAAGQVGIKAAVPTLIAIVRDRKQRWLEAAEALGRLKAVSGVPALDDALAATEPVPSNVRFTNRRGLRRAVLQALGRIGPQAKLAIPAVIRAVEDKETYVVGQAAARTLAQIAPAARVVNVLRVAYARAKAPELRHTILEVLGTLGAKGQAAAPLLLEALRKEKDFVAEVAAESLGRIAPAAGAPRARIVKALVGALEADRGPISRAAATSLGRIGDAGPIAGPRAASRSPSGRRDPTRYGDALGDACRAALKALKAK